MSKSQIISKILEICDGLSYKEISDICYEIKQKARYTTDLDPIKIEDKPIRIDFNEIINNSTKEELIKRHLSIKEFLDIHYNMNDVPSEDITFMMHLEWAFRKAAYPEINKVKFTYRELRELNEEANDLDF